jgi:hypothetical protein
LTARHDANWHYRPCTGHLGEKEAIDAKGTPLPKRRGKRRSPSFPHVPLETALNWSQRILTHVQDYRKASRIDVVRSLGHVALSGPASSKLSTMRAYGLIEKVEEGFRISDDAITAITSQDASEREASLRRLARRPAVFHLLHQFCGDEELIRSHLIKRGHAAFAAKIAADIYLETQRLPERTVMAD